MTRHLFSLIVGQRLAHRHVHAIEDASEARERGLGGCTLHAQRRQWISPPRPTEGGPCEPRSLSRPIKGAFRRAPAPLQPREERARRSSRITKNTPSGSTSYCT